MQLSQTLTKALILHQFDPKRYILIEKDTFSYVIDGILNQLTPKFGQ